MEAAQSHYMIPISRPTLVHRLTASSFKLFCSAATATTQQPHAIVSEQPLLVCKAPKLKVNKVLQAQNRENWLESLSCPFPTVARDAGSDWVIGVDPDASGALALLKPDHSAQVFDSPHLKVLVGGRMRKRLDTKSIVQLLKSLDAPVGTTAYVEQSTPFPKDGKQGWWSGGFGYGLWIGVLVASGFHVVPVSSALWKNEFKLSGRTSNKDDSRELASSMFPSVSSLLKRKKDHGRAEALLIAAYGRGVKMDSSASSLGAAEDC